MADPSGRLSESTARPAVGPLPPSGRPLPGAGSSRLDLLERLLAAEEARGCAEAAVSWLSDELGLPGLVCAGLAEDPLRLVRLASRGSRAKQFAIALDDPADPFLPVLGAELPVRFGRGGRNAPEAPFQRAPFVAFPLHGLAGGAPRPAGVLFVAEATRLGDAVASELQWMCRHLGRRLYQIWTGEQLRERERRVAREQRLLDGLLDAVPDPILLTDADGQVVLANPRAEELFAAGEAPREGRVQAVSRNSLLFSSALTQRVLAAGEQARRELLLVDPADGSDLLFELLSAPVAGEQEGKGSGVVSILRNVTDLRRATEEIEENYRRLRAAELDIRAERDRLNLIIRSVADPILVTDPAGAMVLVNEPAERLFTSSQRPDGEGAPTGTPGEGEARGQAERDNDAQLSSFVSTLFSAPPGQRWRGELTLTDPATGAAIPMEAISGRVLSEQGEVTAIVTILHDQSEARERARLYREVEAAKSELEGKVRAATAELVHQNELLRRQHIELEQASQLKSQFLANVSHEFRTPLNAILGYTSMLLQGVYGPLDGRQERGLRRVDSNAQHLLSIINDILDIAKIEAGRMPVRASEFELPELVGEILSELEPLVERSRLEIRRELADRLPPVHGDRQKIKQVILNLLTNALKFTPRGSVAIRVRLAGEEISVAVVDTGIGIAPSDHQKVFEDFRQVDSSPARPYGGTGLGLSICRRLATTIGGRIDLASELGRGSTFTFSFPQRWRREP